MVNYFKRIIIVRGADLSEFCSLIFVVIVLRLLGLIVVCGGVGEQPTASPPEWARVYCGF